MARTGDKIRTPTHTYTITTKLGSGSYGTVYSATDQHNRNYAIKMSKGVGDRQLKNEHHIYARIKEDSDRTSAVGVPRVYDYFYHHSQPTLIMDLLGSSVKSKARARGGRLSVKSCLMAGCQLVARLEHIHEAGFLHRDIKPDNILTGRKGHHSRRLYVVDLGLAKQYRESCGCHYEYEKGKFAGTIRYAGVNALRGIRASRKDDLEALGYSLVELLRGALPWKRACENEEDECKEIICAWKTGMTARELGEGFPGMEQFMAYVRRLGFDDRPKYSYLTRCFEGGLSSIGERNDGDFDWV